MKKDRVNNHETPKGNGADTSSGYYYDDSTGYEVYRGDEEESEEESESPQSDA